MKRFLWELKLTSKEEHEILAKAVKYKLRLVISRWIARVVSAAFFIWFISGLFSIYFAASFSLNSIHKLSIVSAFPHLFCVVFARDQRDKIAGFERLYKSNEIAIFNRKILAESTLLWCLHGVVAVVSIFSQL